MGKYDRLIESRKRDIAEMQDSITAFDEGMRTFSQKLGEPQVDTTAGSLAFTKQQLAMAEDHLKRLLERNDED